MLLRFIGVPEKLPVWRGDKDVPFGLILRRVCLVSFMAFCVNLKLFRTRDLTKAGRKRRVGFNFRVWSQCVVGWWCFDMGPLATLSTRRDSRV